MGTPKHPNNRMLCLLAAASWVVGVATVAPPATAAATPNTVIWSGTVLTASETFVATDFHLFSVKTSQKNVTSF